MTVIERQELLPADEGARPWLRERSDVPVLWDGDPGKIFGVARVWPEDGKLMADIVLTPEGEGIRGVGEGVALRFGVHGKIADERWVYVQGSPPRRVVESVDLTSISASQDFAFSAGETGLYSSGDASRRARR